MQMCGKPCQQSFLSCKSLFVLLVKKNGIIEDIGCIPTIQHATYQFSACVQKNSAEKKGGCDHWNCFELIMEGELERWTPSWKGCTEVWYMLGCASVLPSPCLFNRHSITLLCMMPPSQTFSANNFPLVSLNWHWGTEQTPIKSLHSCSPTSPRSLWRCWMARQALLTSVTPWMDISWWRNSKRGWGYQQRRPSNT